MASDVAKTLRDRRQKAWHEAKEILTTAAADENRSLTAEEDGKWTSLNSEIDQIDERLKSVLDAEQRSKDTDEAYNRLAGKPEVRATGGASSGLGVSAEELREWMSAIEPRGPVNVSRTRRGSLNLRGGTADPEVRTLLSNNTSSASSTVPIDFYDQLIAFLIEVSGLLQTGPSVLNTAGGETIQIPVASAHITGASAAQGANIPTADPAFAQRTLAAQKFGSLTQLSRELIDDTAVDLLGYLAMSAGRAIGNTLGTSLINGTNGITGGVLSGVTTSVTGSGSVSATKGAPTYNNLVDLEYSVIAPYRQSRSCYWLAADQTIGALRKLVDGNQRPIWEPSAVLGAPDLLLGKPLVSDPFMPALPAVTAASPGTPIAFGDFSQYFVRLVGGLRFERSDDFAFGSDLVTFRALLRADGNWGDTHAVKLFQAGNAA